MKQKVDSYSAERLIGVTSLTKIMRVEQLKKLSLEFAESFLSSGTAGVPTKYIECFKNLSDN